MPRGSWGCRVMILGGQKGMAEACGLQRHGGGLRAEATHSSCGRCPLRPLLPTHSRKQGCLLSCLGNRNLDLQPSREGGGLKEGKEAAQFSVNPASSNPVFVVAVFRILITFTYRKLNNAHSSQLGGQFFSLACSSLAISPILGPGCCLPSDGGSHCICHCEWSGELPPA